MNNDSNNQTGIAIVGMAGRFPKARDLEEFWQNLCAGRECVSFFSDDELAESAARYKENFVKARAVLEDADLFDAEFFGMNPREASLTDPQHRLFLECAWEALENANCDPSTFSGAIGVFAGMSTNTYVANNLNVTPALTIGCNGEMPAMIGNERDYLTSRVSYKLNLRGPSLNIQTACSTSLVAVSVACQHLLTYQCDMALAGAVSVSFPQKRGYLYQQGGITSPDGHCRPFSADSAGTVSGDGVGVIALKRLVDAVKDGDAIYAVIKGFATNNDGALKTGFTAPSIQGQAEVIAMAQAMAGFEPGTISYIETHGTGTALGDPIEIEGLSRAFRQGTDAKNFCAIGSVKGNIGHLDTAAGMAGLIKTVLALHRKCIPPTLHCVSPNPRINFADSPFRINQKLMEWSGGVTPRRAGVSSFGIGGTNAHVVLEEAPTAEPTSAGRSAELLLVAARTKTALQATAKNLAGHLKKQPQLNLADVAYSLQTGRRAFAQRAILVVNDVTKATEALESFDAKQIFVGAAPKETPSLVFMFPGQGAQHVNMGRQLYEVEPVFRKTVDHCCALLQPQLGFDLKKLLFPPADQIEAATQRLKETGVTQPAMFVVEYALAQLWISWGIQPAAMIGHSLGEYVAACIAGVFELGDALALIAARGRMMQALPQGKMIAVRLPEAEVRPLLTEDVSLAAVNAAAVCVVSGPNGAIEAFEHRLAERNAGCIVLQTSHAFHSAMMEPMLAPFAELVQKTSRQPPRIPFVSNVTGTWITDAQAVDPAYWSSHLRQAVRFADGLGELCKTSRIFLEVGPGQTLSGLTRQHVVGKTTAPVVASLPRGNAVTPELQAILTALGQLWINGVSPAWEKFHAGENRRRVWLPTYPFERKRYWVEPAGQCLAAVSAKHNSLVMDEAHQPGHDKVGDMIAVAGSVPPAGGQTCSRLRKLVGNLSGLEPAAIDGKATFTQLGFDSLFLTQASVAVEREFGVRIAFRQLLEVFPTLDSLAEHIERSPSSQAPAATAAYNDGDHVRPAIAKDDAFTLAPLTESQREIWLASQMSEAASSVYNECRLLRLTGPLQTEALRNAVQKLIARHEALRTTFEPDGDAQRIHQTTKIDIPLTDWSHLETAEREKRLDTVQMEEARQPFDIIAGPLIRTRLIQLAENDHVLVMTVHHLVCDGYSFGILLHDLGELYSAESHGQPCALPAPLQFSAYARVQVEREQSAAHAADEKYWISQFAVRAPVLELPTDRPRNSSEQFDGGREGRVVPQTLGEQLKRVSGERGGTLFTTLFAAYTLLLRRLSRQKEIVVGVPLADRGLEGGSTLVGHCVNFLPLRTCVDDDQSLAAHIGAMQKVFLDADEHGHYALGSLVQKLNLPRDPGRMPLVAATFNLERVTAEPTFSGIETELSGNAHSSANFDISFDVVEAPTGLQLNCRYNASLFSAHTIQGWLAQYQTLLEGVAADPQRRVRELLSLVEDGRSSAPLPEQKPFSGAYATRIRPGEVVFARNDDCEKRLAAIWQEVLGIEHIGPNDDFFELGGHSLLALRLVAQIESVFGKRIPVASVFQARTVAQMAVQLRDKNPEPASSIVEVQPQGSRPPLMLVHGAGGGMLWGYTALAQQLGPDQPVYAFESRGRGGLEEPDTIEEMARRYVAELREFQPRGPYCLGGYCFGGNVAYEMARELRAQGQEVALLALINCVPPNSSYDRVRFNPAFCARFLKNLIYWSKYILQLRRGYRLEFLRWKLRAVKTRLLHKLGLSGVAPVNFNVEDFVDLASQPEAQRNLWRKHVYALFKHQPKPYAGNITLFRTRGHPLVCSFDETFGWAELAQGSVTVEIVPGAHETIMDESQVGTLADALRRHLPKPNRTVEVEEMDRAFPYSLNPVSRFMSAEAMELNRLVNAPFIGRTGELYVGNTQREIFHSFSHACLPSQLKQRMGSSVPTGMQTIQETINPSKSSGDAIFPPPGRGVTSERTGVNQAECIHQLFEGQVARTPAAVAIVFQNERMSYAELNRRADGVARQLRALGIGRDMPVGICLERSPSMLVAVLAVLKSGGAYLPLDPTYPMERLKFMIENCQSPLVLTQRKLNEGLNAEIPNRKLLCIEDLLESSMSNDAKILASAHPEPDPQASDLAYIIHTSGSTGVPKGVAIEHRNAVNFIRWAQQVFPPEELVGVLFATSLCFDLSVFELFVTLSTGGKVIIARNAMELPELPAMNEVTLINTVPSAANELLRCNGIPASVQVINLAGEPLKTPLVDRLYALGTVKKVHDLYGPSETTTYSTYTLREAGARATIGRPIANTQIHLLDEHKQPVPTGEVGEMYIGGAGVARGYLHRPDLTAEKFIHDPFSPERNARLYRTGDLARWRDGNLEYLGRIDHQIKIRGFRIELGEIESVLTKHPAVRECVVMAREDTSDEKRLVAYIVHSSSNGVSSSEFRNFLKQKLPEYMVPSAFVPLEALPLTPNGKLDRKKLPAPEFSRPDTAGELVAPGTATEQTIAKVWHEVLGWEQIGIHDNFFELGGDSLVAVQVVSRLRETFQIEVPVAALFDSPTIALMGKALADGRWAAVGAAQQSIASVRREGKIPLSFSQQRLWFIDQLSPGAFAYNMPLALRLEGSLDGSILRECLNEIVSRHEILRTTFPNQAGEPEQRIAQSVTLELPLIDLCGQAAEEREPAAAKLMETEARRPFDLSGGPLLRATLLRLSETTHVLVVVMHHIVSDGWSLDILLKELGNLLEARTGGNVGPLNNLPIQYADYAVWQRESAREPKLLADLAYWRQTLAGAPPSLKMPADGEDSRDGTSPGARAQIVLSKEVTEQLDTLNRRTGSTAFMTLLTALVVTLNRWTRQADIVVGTVSAGRTRRETEALIGCFMNFLAIRTALRDEDTAIETLARVKEAVLAAHAHLDCPFEKVVEALNPERKTVRNPIYNVGFLLENFPKTALKTRNLTGTLMPLETNAALLDLRFIADANADGIVLTCEYRTDLFASRTIEELLASFTGVLEKLTESSEAKLTEFSLAPGLTEQPEASVAAKDLVTVTSTFTAEPLTEPLEFWLQETKLPARIEFAPYNQVFQQLLDPGSQLSSNASGLNVVLVRMEDWAPKSGAGKATESGFTAGIERTLGDLVSALRSAAGRSATPILLCVCPSAKALARNPELADFFERMQQRLATELASIANLRLVFPEQLSGLYPVAAIYDPRSDELGNVPYTPEFFTALGTMIARRFHSQKRSAPKVIVLDCDNTLWAGVCGEDGPAGIKLDAPYQALQEFMRAQLDAGRLLCLCSKNNPEDVKAVFERRHEMPLKMEDFVATRINWSPKSENLSSLAQELNLGIDSFVLVDDNPVECAEVQANTAGALTIQLPETPEHIPDFLKHCWLFDQRSATAEDRQRADFYRQEQQRKQVRTDSLSMAEFLTQLDLKVNISEMSPEQADRVAQLTVRTNQFNTTGHRRTEAEIRVMQDQFKVMTVSLSDRFGDYGLVGVMISKMEEGVLGVESFLLSCRALGRGVEHRMLSELGKLAKAQGAVQVAVHFTPSAKNKPALNFLETAGSSYKQALNGGYLFRFPTDVAATIRFSPQDAISDSSPAQPVTQAATSSSFSRYGWIALEASRVPQIEALIKSKGSASQQPGREITAPTTDIEREICRIWQELLRMEQVGIHDDFFVLGGHSLLAVRLFALMEERLHIKLPIITIFQSPTIAQLAKAAAQQISQPSDLGFVPIQPAGDRPPLFMVHGAGGDVLWGYANLAQHTGADQPIYGIQAGSTDDFTTLEEMAARYVERLRMVQPAGPYHLGGYCFGGNVAQEMARQLEGQGHKVATLALLDSSASNCGYENPHWWKPTWLLAFTRNGARWVNDFLHLKPEERRSLVQRKVKTLPRKVWGRISGRQSAEEFDLEEFIDTTSVSARETRLWKNHLGLLVRHVSKPYGGPITLLRTRSHPMLCSFADDLGWGRLATNVTIKRIPGTHEGIFIEPHVRCLAAELKESLRASHRESTSQVSSPAFA